MLKLGTLIVGDADLAFCNNVNCFDRFLWIKDGSCGIPVKGQSFNQVWTCLVFLARKGSSYPNEGKFLSKEKALVRFGLSWNFWSKMVQVAPVKEKKYESD